MNRSGRARLGTPPARGRSPRVASILAILLVGLVVAAPLAGSAGAAACGGVVERGEWTSISAPEWSQGEARIQAHAVDVQDARHLYLTNGSAIAVSSDGGCRWKQTFTGDGLASGLGSYQILSIVSPMPRRAVATVREEAGAARPRVVVTDDGGESWRVAGTGLPPAGDPEFIRVLGDAGEVLYLGVDVGGGALDFLYWSVDGGDTWSLRSDLTKLKANAGIRGVEVDPVDTEVMWAYGEGGLYRSDDGGASFEPVEEFSGEATGPMDLFHDPGMAARLIVFTPDSREFQVSTDGGETWFRNATPSGVDAVDHGAFAEDVLITASGYAYRYHAGTYFFFNLEAPSEVRAISAHRIPNVSYFAHSDTTIEKYVEPRGDGDPGDLLRGNRDISYVGDKEVEEESSFGPGKRRLVLERGERETVTYKLQLPKRRLPLDVYFLMDTTDSMDSVLDASATAMGDIMNTLAGERLDVEFGLAEHRAYPDMYPPKPRCQPGTNPPPQTCDHNFVYERVLKLPAGGDAVAQALSDLQTAGGGIYDAQLGALYQAATGAGQQFDGAARMHNVPPGQQAVFRDKADGLRVIIHPTDEPFGTRESGGDRDGVGPGMQVGPAPDIPTTDEVIAELKARDISYVGLAIGDIRKVSQDQQEIARGTGTFAPPGGVDCDGDGNADLAEGEPLVCRFPRRQADEASNVAQAILELLLSRPNRSDVELEVRSGRPVVANVTPKVHPRVLLQTSQDLTFDVTYMCTGETAGKTFPVRLGAVAEHLDLEVVTRVVCEEDDTELPPALSAIPLVGVGIPPPLPPPPAHQLSQATQMHAQAQAQAQAGAAHQEEEQPQMAFVTAFGEMAEQELAFSRYDGRRRMPADAALGAGIVALGMMAAAGTALARRTRLQRSHIHNLRR